MKKTYTCIVCPNGCEISAERGSEADNYIISGALCKRGEEYVRQELTDPRRTFATTVAVTGSDEPLISVRLTAPIPLGKVKEAADEIHRIRLQAPVKAGDILMEKILGFDSSLIATSTAMPSQKR